jgi:hypothetical protein
MPKSNMYFLIYSSKADSELDEKELKKILETSKHNNQKRDITGLLILYKDTFIQMLEGKEEDVLETYDAIQDDDRHDSVMTIFEGRTDKRHFPSWKMALEVVDEKAFRKIDAYESLEESDRFLEGVDDSHIGLKMLRFFYHQKKD